MFLILCVLFISLLGKSQLYYAGHPGIYTGRHDVYNYILEKNESLPFSGFFFTMPIGYKGAIFKNVLLETELGYAGDIITGAYVGYQMGGEEGNLQFLAGPKDYISPSTYFKDYTHTISYNVITRVNCGHFFFQGAYSASTIFVGLGFKAFAYE